MILGTATFNPALGIGIGVASGAVSTAILAKGARNANDVRNYRKALNNK